MNWTAVVPLKQGGLRKSRLAMRLDGEQRWRLSEAMVRHVLASLGTCREVDRILLLSPDPHAWPHVDWRADQGRGLNFELGALREQERSMNLLVVHADLPLLSSSEVSAFVAAARPSGRAIAPDRHDMGTNAVALATGQTLDFAFGPDSFACHRAQAPDAAILRPPGLALDVDTPEDLDAAQAAGFVFQATAG